MAVIPDIYNVLGRRFCMAYETIEIERVVDDRISVVRLARPEQNNVINRQVLADLTAAVESADRDKEIDAIVLGSTDTPFCTGASLEEINNLSFNEGARWMGAYFETLDLLRTTGKPVVAAVEGTCVAGGHELVMACDLVIAGDSARVGQPEVGVGSTAGGGGLQLLPLQVGEKRARELLLTGDLLKAEEARDWGLINRVVDDGDAEIEAVALAEQIINTKSPQAYRAIKSMMKSWSNFALVNQEATRDATARVWDSVEFSERAEAFLAREEQKSRSFHGTLPRDPDVDD